MWLACNMTNETTFSASRVIPAAAKDIFDVLSNPERHADIDPSGMVRSVDQGERLKAVGDTFTMNMTKDDGDYQTENEVFAFQDGRVIGWKNLRNLTAGVEVGAKWLYELEPIDATSATVTLTYDRGDIEDPELFAKSESFSQGLEDSLAKLDEVLAG